MFSCPECEQVINQASEVCPFCGADLRAAEFAGIMPARSSRKTAVALIALLAAVCLVVWFAMPSRRVSPGASTQQIVPILKSVQGLLAGFDAAQGYFPNSLEDLGPPVRALAEEAQSADYHLLYIPGLAGSDGRIHSYNLLARPRNYGSPSFFTDESGVIRRTKENRAATAQDPPA